MAVGALTGWLPVGPASCWSPLDLLFENEVRGEEEPLPTLPGQKQSGVVLVRLALPRAIGLPGCEVCDDYLAARGEIIVTVVLTRHVARRQSNGGERQYRSMEEVKRGGRRCP